MTTAPFFGYPGQVWASVYAALNYFGNSLNAASTPASVDALAAVTLETVLNGLSAINAQQFLTAWQAELVNIQSVQALPITIDPTTAAFLANRSSAYAAAINGLAPLIPQAPFPTVANTLPQGAPTIPDPGILTYYENFGYESAPAGLTVSNFTAQAQAVATAFGTVATAIQVLQGHNLTQAYDTATRQQETAQAAATMVASYSSGPISASLPISSTWNEIVTLPAMVADAALLSSAPYSLAVQQSLVIRYVMLTVAQQLALFLLALRQPVASQVNLATVLNGDTLMDVAARSLGNFEEWTSIATTNSLQPPYVGVTASPGVAAYGSQILLPTSGAQPSALSAPPSYTANFLGIDLYIGPINGPMPPWTGDFQTIAGYQNLAISLGRRLQTTLGTLIYHSDYGSRIPPEVGQVQTSSTAGQIAAFGKSAILSDPRVAAVLAATATLGPNGLVAFQGVVQPGGFGSSPVSINETISPLP